MSDARWVSNVFRQVRDYVRAILPLGGTAHSIAPTDGSVEPAHRNSSTRSRSQGRAEQASGERRLPKRIRSSAAPLRFVDILVEAVERELAQRRYAVAIAGMEADVERLQKLYDDSKAYHDDLARRNIPEIQCIVDETRIEYEQSSTELHAQWKDGRGRTYSCGLVKLLDDAQANRKQAQNARDRMLARLLGVAPAILDQALEHGRIAGLPLGQQFCIALQQQIYGAEAVKSGEEDMIAKRKAFQASNRGVDRTRASKALEAASRLAEVRRKNQEQRVGAFLYDTAYPVLVEGRYMLPETEPSVPSTPSSLSMIIERGPEGSLNRGRMGEDSDDEEVHALRVSWRDARAELASCQRQLTQAKHRHAQFIADHLATYPSATLQTAEREYERKTSNTYQSLLQSWQELVDEAQVDYDNAFEAAVAAGIDIISVSPVYAADRDEDGHTESAGTKFDGFLEGERLQKRPRIERWAQNAARGLPARSPRPSASFSIASVGSRRSSPRIPEAESNVRLIREYTERQSNMRIAAGDEQTSRRGRAKPAQRKRRQNSARSSG